MILDQEIDELNQLVLKMVDQVTKNISDAFDTYRQDCCEYSINDDIVDQLERLIEEMSLHLILKERLYARDLRLVSGVLKMVADLERIGDHAEDIMNLCIKYKGLGRVHFDTIDKMFDITRQMVQNSIISFVNRNLELAQDVIRRDEEVDEDYSNIIAYIIALDDTNQITSSLAIYTTLVVKYVERIADHAVNIANGRFISLMDFIRIGKFFRNGLYNFFR